MSSLGVRTPEQAASDVTVFKALANPVRLRIVSFVAAAPEGQASAGQIVEAFELSQPTISHHLRLLREAGVLTTYKTSTYVFYRFAPTLIESVSAVLPARAAAAPPVDSAIEARSSTRSNKKSAAKSAKSAKSAKPEGKSAKSAKPAKSEGKSADKAAKKSKSKKKAKKVRTR